MPVEKLSAVFFGKGEKYIAGRVEEIEGHLYVFIPHFNCFVERIGEQTINRSTLKSIARAFYGHAGKERAYELKKYRCTDDD